MTKRTGASRDATIDFRMMRRAYLARVHSGDVPRHDACDASNDLVFAARQFGVQRRSACPLCGQHELRNVTYLFGPRLPKAGKCVTSARQLHEANTRTECFTGYAVEVCLSCGWNHLLSATPYGGRRRHGVRRVRAATPKIARPSAKSAAHR
ncbi:MAG: DUF5318 family protein [Ilumatobacteraceae bacterium]